MTTLIQDRTTKQIYWPIKNAKHEELTSWSEGFGVSDEKGRSIGYFIRISKVTAERDDAVERKYGALSKFEELVTYEAWSTVTKNGKKFGAYQSPIQGTDVAEITKLMQQRVIDAKKRYTKAAQKRAA